MAEAINTMQEPAGQVHEGKLVALFPPSREMAFKVMRKVDSLQHLVGQRFFQRKAGQIVDLCSLEDVIEFLGDCGRNHSMDELLKSGSPAAIGYLDLASLRDWVDKVLGDQELAEAIGSRIGESYGTDRRIEALAKHFRQHAVPIKQLLEQRVRQSRTIIGREPTLD